MLNLAPVVMLAALAAPEVALQTVPPASPPKAVIIGYVFPQERPLAPDEVDASRLTHINYAFANVKDGRLVEGFDHDDDNLRVLTGLRARNPRLRVLVSVGGWAWSKGFSDVALRPESRRRFAASAVSYLQRHDLDGLDVDWEYPGLPGDGNPHRPEDGANFTALMRELRAALDAAAGAGKRYLLTFAAGAAPDYLAHTPVGDVHAFVDYVNLMTYDFRVPGAEPEAGHNANLLTNPADPSGLSAERAVREFLAAGVPPQKLVLGVPFYGRAWEVKNADYGPLYQPGKPASGFGHGSYAVLRELPAQAGWLRLWDDAAQAAWLWNPERRVFVSYEDPRSLRLKCKLVRERGLGGVMFWEYSEDAGGELLRTLYDELLAPPR